MALHLQRYREIAHVMARNGLMATAVQAGLSRWLPLEEGPHLGIDAEAAPSCSCARSRSWASPS